MREGASTDPTGDGSRAKVVFFVDDDDQLRAVTARLLRKRGYEVVVAATAEEASEILESHEGDLDVLLMDINLPDGWGATVAHRLTAERPDLAVVYTTGFAENDAVLQSGLGHTDFVVTKPFTGDQLVAELERAMASKS
jgi:CheY-like chemotaxis protein